MPAKNAENAENQDDTPSPKAPLPKDLITLINPKNGETYKFSWYAKSLNLSRSSCLVRQPAPSLDQRSILDFSTIARGKWIAGKLLTLS